VRRNLQEGGLSLFGGKVRVGETVKDAMYRKIKDTIKCTGTTSAILNINSNNVNKFNFAVGELLSIWHRPNFDQSLFPYVPLQCSRPKERVEVYQLLLPERCTFHIKNSSEKMLDIVPVHELLTSCECPILNAVPTFLSRFSICRMEAQET